MHFSLFPRMLANVGYHACGSVVSHSQNAVLPQPREGRGQRPEVLSGVLELAARPSSRWSPSHRGWPCGPDVSGGLCGGGMQSVQGRANGERLPSGRACAAGEECEFGMLGGREAQTSTHTHTHTQKPLPLALQGRDALGEGTGGWTSRACSKACARGWSTWSSQHGGGIVT